jgi:hypothetical protein
VYKTQHRQPSGHLQLQLQRNVPLMVVRCYAVSLDTATYSICRARSRWLELKLVTPASLRHCLSYDGQEGRRDQAVETAPSCLVLLCVLRAFSSQARLCEASM